MIYDFRLTLEAAVARFSYLRRRAAVRMIQVLAVCSFLSGPSAMGQWVTQSFELKAGWNAVYTHVDSSYATLNALIGDDPNNPIIEVWAWEPAVSLQQFIQSPQLPTTGNSQWASWSRALGPTSALQRLGGNIACLVRVDSAVPNYVWQLKGKPALPQYQWTTTGLNFLGFPTPAAAPPWFDDFLAKSPELQQKAEVYHYPGGELGVDNPARLFAFRSTPLRRGQAYWIRSGTHFNRYFGPFELTLQSEQGAHFRDTGGQYRFRIRNATAQPVTVNLNLLASEAPPVGEQPVLAAPPLMARGELDLTTLRHGYFKLAEGPRSWTLSPQGQQGSDIEVIIGLNRSQMSGNPGDLYAGILRFTDTLNLSQVDVPVSAEMASTAGLWVGGASVNYVSHYLKNYARAESQIEFARLLDRLGLVQGQDGYNYVRDESTGRVLVFGGAENRTGSYLLDGPVKVDSGKVARPYPLRLIIHNDGNLSRLFQHVYFGVGLGSNEVVTTRETLLLPARLDVARRISAVHLPASQGNAPWTFAGEMRQGGALATTVELAYDDQVSNPFLHTYHPDHDNLDARFETQLPQGNESYGVTRQISLSFTAPDDDFGSLTAGSQTLTGNYAEIITVIARGGETKEFHSLGYFTLKRISNIATLTMP
jgi:hypothetical protein